MWGGGRECCKILLPDPVKTRQYTFAFTLTLIFTSFLHWLHWLHWLHCLHGPNCEGGCSECVVQLQVSLLFIDFSSRCSCFGLGQEGPFVLGFPHRCSCTGAAEIWVCFVSFFLFLPPPGKGRTACRWWGWFKFCSQRGYSFLSFFNKGILQVPELMAADPSFFCLSWIEMNLYTLAFVIRICDYLSSCGGLTASAPVASAIVSGRDVGLGRTRGRTGT